MSKSETPPDVIPRPDLRRAGWPARIAYARRRGWTARQLAKACGFKPCGTAEMVRRLGRPLKG